MTVKIGINGFGRIGRQVFKKIYEDFQGVLDVEAINDLMPVATNAHMLKYDSTYGRFPGKIEVIDDDIYVDGEKLKSFAERDPANLPWGELGVDIVLECTGIFKDGDSAGKHLTAGAKKVLISAPGKDIDGTFVLGVNEETYDPATMHIISNASCTTNCLAPAAKVLHENFGIEHALMTTIHAVTNGQKILDMAAKDLRRARSAQINIIPTTTGAAKAVGLVLPELDGKINGMAFRVPVVTGSVVDLTAIVSKETTAEEVNAAFKAAAEGEGWLGEVLEYTEDPVVSTDFIGYDVSSTIDGLSTEVSGGNMVKVVAWYDNEWGYSSRLADLCAYVAESL
jgi:glyceraldehyde 3-phosphate dehydrogenase